MLLSADKAYFYLGGNNEKNITAEDNADFWLAKYNISSDLIWEDSFGGNNFDAINDLAIDSKQNLIAIGESWSDQNSSKKQSTLIKKASISSIKDKSILSTNEATKSTIDIYPNPIKDILNFKTKEKIKKVELFDVSGRLIKTFLGVENNQINLAETKKGNYVLKVYIKEKTFTQKIIKD